MIIACYVLHYGREWLKYSIRSVIDRVDEVCIFYSPIPSHGHGTNMVNPETRGDLLEITQQFEHKHKVYWYDAPGPFEHEGKHRTWAVNTCRERGADKVLVVDFDEIWPPAYLEYALANSDDFRTYRVSMRHFWRSLGWYCDDPAMPTRIINWTSKMGEEGYLDPDECKVLHMGYAQSPAIIEYKQSIHGHKGEWRDGWFENIFMAWKPGDKDVHPTNIDYWTPVQLYWKSALKPLFSDHPYWGKEIIE